MQEGIIQIGQAVYSEDNIVDNIVVKLNSVKGKNKVQQHVLKFNFSTKENKMVLDTKEEIKENTAKKYLYVEKIGSPRLPQWLVSKNSCQYHLTEIIPNLCELPLGEELNKKFKFILQNYYVDLGENEDKKYRYFLNLKILGISNEDVVDVFKKITEENNDKKEAYKLLVNFCRKSLEDYVKGSFGIKPDEIGLYTILVDDEPIAARSEYKDYVIKKKMYSGEEKSDKGLDDNSKKSTYICSMCGSKVSSLGELEKISIKTFTTNQVIFANELDRKNYSKNMTICSDCMKKLLSGENYIKNNLDTTLGGFNLYLIPHFIVGQPLNKEELDEAAKSIKYSFNNVKNYEGIKEFKLFTEQDKALNDEKFYYLINMMFYKKVNQGTKVQRLIRDVNPSVFEEIAENSTKVKILFNKIVGENYRGTVSLESVYHFTPVRLKQGENMQYNRLLSIYDGIFTERRLDKEVIIKNILDTAEIIILEKQGYNIKVGGSFDVGYTIVNSDMYVKFLEYMGCLKEEENLVEYELNVKEDIKGYIKGMGYNEQQDALFLLGCLMGEIGNKEYSRSSEGKKPVLNKLNFGGMDKSRLVRLVNEIFNKLNQEKILKYNEKTFGECKRLFDKNQNSWKLNKDENLYYILSGYGYATTRPMLNKKEGENDNE